MHWKDTLLKSEGIKWKQKMKHVEDGKLDFDFHLPLTSLFEAQAKKSFSLGLYTLLMFHVEKQGKGEAIDVEDLLKFFEECGADELAKGLQKKLGKVNET